MVQLCIQVGPLGGLPAWGLLVGFHGQVGPLHLGSAITSVGQGCRLCYLAGQCNWLDFTIGQVFGACSIIISSWVGSQAVLPN